MGRKGKLLCALLLTLFSLQLAFVAEAAAPTKRKTDTERKNPARFARIAILPVICLEEEIDYANTIVFQKALDVFRYPDYEIYDNEKVYAALDDLGYYNIGKEDLTEEMLREIMRRAGLDAVVAVKLNELTQSYYPYGREDYDQLVLDMQIMAVFDWKPKALNTKIRDKKISEYAPIMKIDWKMTEYSKAVNIQLERIAKQGKK